MEKAYLAAACLAVVLLAGCTGPTVHTATYATLAEARAAGAIENGWVPADLPQGTYELRAAYAVDSWERWGLFNFHPGDAAALRAMLEPEEVPLTGTRMEIPGRIEWWPVILRGNLDAERISTTGLQAYRSRSGDRVFGVNWNQGRAYYWTTR